MSEEVKSVEKAASKAKKRERVEAIKQKSKRKKEEQRGNFLLTNRPEVGQRSGLSAKQAYALLLKFRPEASLGETKLRKDLFVAFKSSDSDELGMCAFASAIKQYHHCGKKAMKNKLEAGHPVVVIVCSGARRAVQVIKSLSQTLKYRVAKLFAKHLKVEDQVEDLKKKFPIAVGTPSRLMKLYELGALQFSSTHLLLIDGNRDTKKTTVFSSPSEEERSDFFRFCDAFVDASVHKGNINTRLSIIDDPQDAGDSDSESSNED